jgi:hypothetical protein
MVPLECGIVGRRGARDPIHMLDAFVYLMGRCIP